MGPGRELLFGLNFNRLLPPMFRFEAQEGETVNEVIQDYDVDAFVEDLADYRTLKDQRDKVDAKMSAIKTRLEPAVKAMFDGKFEDDDGYIKVITRKPSVSYSNADVEKLADVWAGSEDPTMKACGEMLRTHRKEKSGYTYIQVK